MYIEKMVIAMLENKGLLYVKDAVEKVYGSELKNPTNEEKNIALLVQLNINIQRLSDLLFIATGLDEDDVPESAADTFGGNHETLSLKSESVMCPFCQQPTIPDSMGYCKKCKRDLAGYFHKRKL